MCFHRKGTIYYQFCCLFCLLNLLFFCQCRRDLSSAEIEHTGVLYNNTVFVQIIPSQTYIPEKLKVDIVFFLKEGEDLEKIKKSFTDFNVSGYELVFLIGDWLTIFQESQKAKDRSVLCHFLETTFNENKKILVIPNELGCFVLSPEIQSDCIDGVILLSPFCNENIPQAEKGLLYVPTFISVGENDEKSYKYSLQLYQKNQSLCEMRTYPTDFAGFELLDSFYHSKEQIKLWIETILSNGK